MLFSKYLNLDDKLSALGVFDCLLDEDSHFFINVVLLKETDVPEFKNSYNKLIRFFEKIFILLKNSKQIDDKFYRQAFKMFKFEEINEINLGFAIKNGSSFGPQLRRTVLNDAFEIIHAGCNNPEIFFLMELFEEKIGPDRISDMISSIIKEDIIAYTTRINKELEIEPKNYPDKHFEDGFLINEYKSKKVYYLPKCILNVIPIAKEWSDIRYVMLRNQYIRDQINSVISEEWYNLSNKERKQAIKRDVFLLPDKCNGAVNEYKKVSVDQINVAHDYKYGSREAFEKHIIPNVDFRNNRSAVFDSKIAANDIIEIFKRWVENNKGWSLILDFPTINREKYVQRLLHLSAEYYAISNGIDLSFEANEGNGPVDLKLSFGCNDKTVVELKLSSNPKYLHGYEVQIREYAAAENTNKMIYVLVDVNNPRRIETIKNIHKNDVSNGVECPELIIIDSKKKNAASTA